jgi:uncharacterized C2H2 Zn-finger protein
MKTDIINHRHKFKIEDQEIELKISFIKGLWRAEVISGETGMGNCSGGIFENIEEYIKDVERHHTYQYNFGKYGYKQAKEIYDNN